MPDLTPETAYACNSHTEFRRTVLSSGDPKKAYTVRHQELAPDERQRQMADHGFTCTCPAFMYSEDRTCKHIKAVKETACLWDSHVDGGEPARLESGPACPFCGKPATPYTVMV